MALPFNLVRRCRPADVREGTGLEPVRGRVACGQGNLPADPGPCVAKRVHFIHPSRPWSARNDERGLKTRGAVGAWCLLATEKVRSYPEPRGGRSRFSRKKGLHTHCVRTNRKRMRTKRARSPNGPAPSEGQVMSSVRPPRAARASSPRGQAHGKTNFGFRRFGAVEASPVTATSREDCGNCVDDDGDGRTDYEDPACCTQTAAMQVKKALIVPGPAGAMKGNLSLIAILAQAGFADVDPTRDDVTVQLRNQNGELLCANIAHQRWKHGSRRGPFQFGDPTGTVAQGLRKMEIKVSKSGSARFLTAGKKMDLGRYARPELTATVRVGDRCSTATIALRSRKNKKFVYP